MDFFSCKAISHSTTRPKDYHDCEEAALLYATEHIRSISNEDTLAEQVLQYLILLNNSDLFTSVRDVVRRIRQFEDREYLRFPLTSCDT